MSSQVTGTVDVCKGAVCYALDKFSVGAGARKRVQTLRDELAALAPTFDGLAECFGEFLLPSYSKKKASRQAVVDYLKEHWFPADHTTGYFPNVLVAQIYGTGVIQALDLSLGKTGTPVPIDSWWMLDCAQVELNSMVQQQGGTTISKMVSLMICTPRPRFESLAPNAPTILGRTAEAYTTRQVGRKIVSGVRTTDTDLRS